MVENVPAEISMGWVFFPPAFLAAGIGLIGALGIAKVLSATGWARFFWHPGLVFVACWLLLSSLIGLFVIPT